MASKSGTWRQKIQQHPFVTMGIIALLIAFLAFALAVHWLGWDWTGFTGYSPPILQYQRGKTLWDWLQLLGVLAVPVVVGFGAVWFTTRQGKVSSAENTDNQHETALQAYINKMSELLLHEKLRDSAEEDEVRKIARVRTLTVLHGLDPIRKASVIQFLHESGLIDKDKCVISLSGASLRNATLGGVTLSGAILTGADLRSATGATEEGLEKQASSLSNATMPNWSKHPE
jgi:hypothetical protein